MFLYYSIIGHEYYIFKMSDKWCNSIVNQFYNMLCIVHSSSVSYNVIIFSESKGGKDMATVLQERMSQEYQGGGKYLTCTTPCYTKRS